MKRKDGKARAQIEGHACAFRVRGDAMQNPAGFPTYPDGVRIVVDPDRDARDRVLVNVGGQILFRQLLDEGGHRWLSPIDGLHERLCSNSSCSTILGREAQTG